MRLVLLALVGCFAALGQRPVVVVSVDALDARYLNDADRLGLRVPNLRRLMREGQWARGVVGVAPTVTWPSHTTLISGVDPAVHGILGNRRPRSEGGDYYWSSSLLKARTLLDAARAAGKRTAAITWPVTVDAPVTYNLPEYFQKRRGGAMDLPSIASKAVPAGLADEIAHVYPSFPQEWMDDRTRTLATVYLLEKYRPDLLLVHLVDLDAEAHDNGPFSREANAVLEYTDECLGRILAALPREAIFLLVSDHGFERIDREVNLTVIAAARGLKSGLRPLGGVAVADTPEAATFLRQLRSEERYGIGREIPKDELQRFAPPLAAAEAVFEPAAHQWFGAATSGEEFRKPDEPGKHGHWPTRYRATFLAWGRGLAPARVEEFSIQEIAPKIAAWMGIAFEPGPKR